jgi:PAS domain S-box-containing protein
MTALSPRVGKDSKVRVRLYAFAARWGDAVAGSLRLLPNLRPVPKDSFWPVALLGIVVLKMLVSLFSRPDSVLVAYGGIPYFLLLLLATGFALRNGIQNALKGRPFWLLLAIGYGLWAANQWIFIYYQFGPHIEVPDNSMADPLLFMHVAVVLAAAATLPHRNTTGRNLYGAILNSVLCIIFWGFLYFCAVFPYRLFSNAAGYALGFDTLYLLENWALILAVGFMRSRAPSPWRFIYLHLLGASILYALSSVVANLAIDTGGYVNGRLYGIGLTASACWFVWIPLCARRFAGSQLRTPRLDSRRGSQTSAWAMLAVVIISIPVLWELSTGGRATGMTTFRLLVAITAIVALAIAAFLKEHLAKAELASHFGSTNNRLHLAMESGKAVGWEWDIKTGIVSWVGDLKTNFGVQSDTYEETPEEFHRRVFPADRERVLEAMADAKRNHRLYEVEYRIVSRDGALHWIAARGEFLYSTKGEPERMMGTAVDISDQKQLKAELIESQERMCAIVESSHDAIISKNLDGIILSWNAGAQRLFEYTEQEALGQPTKMLIPDGLWDEDREIQRRIRDGQRIEHYETVRLTKSGKTVYVSLTVSPVRDSTGTIIGASKTARDITERKRAEQVLRESEDRFRLVANTAPVLIWMSGSDNQCNFFNQSWLRFTGRSLEDELGDGWASAIHPDDREHCLATYAAAFDARTDCQLEYRLRRFDGVYRWIFDFSVPRFESDGTFRGYIGSCVDITDSKESEESLHSLTGRLISAQEEERARIARELHDDFSQRLALLGIGLSLLWKKLPKSDSGERTSVKEMLEAIREMSTDMHALSHRLHSSKLEHVGLVPAISGLCREIAEKYKMVLDFEQSGCSHLIPKDVALCLFRVAQEALANVLKHSKAQCARVELRGSGDRITLLVSDDGRGFDPRLQNPQAGIGLIGMAERLRLLKGKLTVNSDPNRGTEIIAELPLAIAERAAQANAQFAGR